MEGAAEGVSGLPGRVRADIGKRLIKSPKVYIADSALARHLLGIDMAATTMSLVHQSPLAGAHATAVAPGVQALPLSHS